MKSECVTIGITCFNARGTVLRALESAVAQDWQNRQIIVVDDCSTDDSAEVVRQFVLDHPEVQFIMHKNNLGAAGARNTILGHARGNYIAFFDDDDESLPKRVGSQMERFKEFKESNPGRIAICYAAGERHYENGYIKKLPAIGASEGTEPRGAELANYLLLFEKVAGREYGSGTPSCSMMAPTEAFRKFGKFDTTFKRVEDVEFAIRAALSGAFFIGTREKLFIQHSTVGEDKNPEKNRDAEIILADKFRVYLSSVGLYYYAKNWPLLRYYHFKKNYLFFLLTFAKLTVRHPFRTFRHLLQVGPARLRHESRMRRRLE